MVEIFAYASILAPAVGFIINGILLRWLLSRRYGGGTTSVLAGYVNLASIGAAFVFACIVLINVVQNGALETDTFSWVALPGLDLRFGLILDPLTALMLILVSGISLLVQIYSLYYMKGEKSYARFFAFMALFTASMLGLVASRNLVQIFIFWELVGLCSYFLISFWADRPSAIKAARKAFLMTRLGDFGFLLAIMYVAFLNPTWLDVTEMYNAVHLGLLTSAAASWIVLGLLAGIVGKSAQMPLHAWLADAMEGPTPVSALLHSATMVTAGVFLIARVFPLFEYSNIQPLVAIIGIITAIVAATMGMASNDIKRVLAFSTVSQIGYMTFALGIGAYSAAVFHLFIHAFFKAGLFMVAGNVGHATHTFDMRQMGGLRRKKPITYAVALICGLSLAAVFPLSGFWSKDEIVNFGFENGWAVGSVLLLVVSVLTAFYTFRLIYLTFHGKSRQHSAETDTTSDENAQTTGMARRIAAMIKRESVLTVAPMAILSLGAVLLGYIANPVAISLGSIGEHAFSSFITHNSPVFPTETAIIEAGGEPHFSILVAALSVGAALIGLIIATLIYARGAVAFRLMDFVPLRHVRTLFARQYYFNELYEQWIVDKFLFRGMARGLERFEELIVDGIGTHIANATQTIGGMVRRFQNGNMQFYALWMFLGVAIVLAPVSILLINYLIQMIF